MKLFITHCPGAFRGIRVGKGVYKRAVLLPRAFLISKPGKCHASLEQRVGIFMVRGIDSVDILELSQGILQFPLGVETFANPVIGVGLIAAIGIILLKFSEQIQSFSDMA